MPSCYPRIPPRSGVVWRLVTVLLWGDCHSWNLQITWAIPQYSDDSRYSDRPPRGLTVSPSLIPRDATVSQIAELPKVVAELRGRSIMVKRPHVMPAFFLTRYILRVTRPNKFLSSCESPSSY